MRKGSKMTDEQKKRLSEAHRGHIHTEIARRNMSLAQKNREHFPCPEEVRKRISATLKGRKMPYVAEANKRRIVSSETRNKRKLIGKSMMNKLWSTPEFKKRMTGENSPLWIKDRSLLKLDSLNRPYDTQYKYWMLSVKRRDCWKCKIANLDCSGRLEAHHILPWKDYPELRYQINNGITLCQAHHPRGRAEVKRLAPEFQKLVSVSS